MSDDMHASDILPVFRLPERPGMVESSGPFRILLDHWESIRGEQLVPCIDDLDELAIFSILPQVQILEITAAGEVFYRRLGAYLMSLTGEDALDRDSMTLVSAENRDIIYNLYRTLVEEPCAAWGAYRNRMRSGAYIVKRKLVLPLRDTDGQCRFMITVQEIDDAPFLAPSDVQVELVTQLDALEFIDIGAGLPV